MCVFLPSHSVTVPSHFLFYVPRRDRETNAGGAPYSIVAYRFRC